MKVGKLEVQKLQGFKIAEKEGRKFVFAWLDETRLFYTEESKRLYLDLVMFEHKEEWCDYLVKESLKKGEDKETTKLDIVGNFKNYVKADGSTPLEPKQEESGTVDDLPF